MTQEQLKLFMEVLETKTNWGKEQLKMVILKILTGVDPLDRK